MFTRSLSIILFALIAASAGAESCPAKKQVYKLVPGSVKFEWTAFKTNEKLAVSGGFTSILVEAPTQAKNPDALLAGVSFAIDGMSVSSGSPERDKSLQESFFGKFQPNANIEGDIRQAQDGKALVELRLNGTTHQIPLTYILQEANQFVEAKGKIDMLEAALHGPFAAIHEHCKLLHTGADGVSKTWTDVELKVSARVMHTCEK